MSITREYELEYNNPKPLTFAIPVYKGEITGNVYGGPIYIALSPYATVSMHMPHLPINMHQLMHRFITGEISAIRLGGGVHLPTEKEIELNYTGHMISRVECHDEDDPKIFNLAAGFYPLSWHNKILSRTVIHVIADTSKEPSKIRTLKEHIAEEYGYEPGLAVFESATIAGYFIQHAGELYSEKYEERTEQYCTVADANRQWTHGQYPLEIVR